MGNKEQVTIYFVIGIIIFFPELTYCCILALPPRSVYCKIQLKLVFVHGKKDMNIE